MDLPSCSGSPRGQTWIRRCSSATTARQQPCGDRARLLPPSAGLAHKRLAGGSVRPVRSTCMAKSSSDKLHVLTLASVVLESTGRKERKPKKKKKKMI